MLCHTDEFKLFFISLRVGQCLVQVKNEQLIEACFFKLKFDLFLCADHWELFYLLYQAYRLHNLNWNIFVNRHFERPIWKVFIFFENFLGVKRRRIWRRLLWMGSFFSRTSGVFNCSLLTVWIVLTLAKRPSSHLLRSIKKVILWWKISSLIKSLGRVTFERSP